MKEIRANIHDEYSFINEILNDINNGNTHRDYLYYETTEALR